MRVWVREGRVRCEGARGYVLYCVLGALLLSGAGRKGGGWMGERGEGCEVGQEN